MLKLDFHPTFFVYASLSGDKFLNIIDHLIQGLRLDMKQQTQNKLIVGEGFLPVPTQI